MPAIGGIQSFFQASSIYCHDTLVSRQLPPQEIAGVISFLSSSIMAFRRSSVPASSSSELHTRAGLLVIAFLITMRRAS
jgi:hypothetical protein